MNLLNLYESTQIIVLEKLKLFSTKVLSKFAR